MIAEINGPGICRSLHHRWIRIVVAKERTKPTSRKRVAALPACSSLDVIVSMNESPRLRRCESIQASSFEGHTTLGANVDISMNGGQVVLLEDQEAFVRARRRIVQVGPPHQSIRVQSFSHRLQSASTDLCTCHTRIGLMEEPLDRSSSRLHSVVGLIGNTYCTVSDRFSA